MLVGKIMLSGNLVLEYSLSIRSENSIIKIPIRSDEYYLVECRSNWIKPNVSIDSLRFEIGSNSYSELTHHILKF